MSYQSKLPRATENYEQYLQYIASLDIPLKEKYELLSIVNSLLIYFIDQAFGVQTDQITLRSIGDGFNASPDHATIQTHPENQIAVARSDGVESDSNSLGAGEP